LFTENELDEARSVPILQIAERYGAKLKKSGAEWVGPCPHPQCGGVDRFSIRPDKNIFNCRGCGTGGDAIALEMHLSGAPFADAVRALIGQDAGTSARRQPTPDEIAKRTARETERKRAEAEEQRRNESSAAKILARLQPIIGTPGEAYLRDVRQIDLNHWAVRRALEDVATVGWCERICFWQPDPNEQFHTPMSSSMNCTASGLARLSRS
jgi:hypothetical protein